MPIDRTEIAVGVGPFIPNAHAMLVEVFDIGIAAQEPEQLVDDRFDVQLLGGQQWKATLKVEPHLMPEDRARADAGAIAFFDALAEHTLHQVEILAHLALRSGRFDLRSLASNEWPTKPAQGDYGIPVWSRWSPRRRGPVRVQKCLDSRLRRNERNCAVGPLCLNYVHHDVAQSIDREHGPFAGVDRHRRNEAAGDHDHAGFEITAALGDMIGEPGQRGARILRVAFADELAAEREPAGNPDEVVERDALQRSSDDAAVPAILDNQR